MVTFDRCCEIAERDGLHVCSTGIEKKHSRRAFSVRSRSGGNNAYRIIIHTPHGYVCEESCGCFHANGRCPHTAAVTLYVNSLQSAQRRELLYPKKVA